MTNTKDKALKDWMKFLDADEVKFHLTCASLYMTAYELLIDSIVKKTKDFYITGISNNEFIISAEYKKEVKALFPKDIVVASATWLRNSNAISEIEVEQIKEYKKYRNDLAHELPKIISDTEHDIRTEHFPEILDLYKKIQLWWFLEVELPTNPSFDNIELKNINTNEALSLVMLPMEYMINIVNDEIKKRLERKKKKKN